MSFKGILLKIVVCGLCSLVPHLSVKGMNVEYSGRVRTAKIELDLIYECREAISTDLTNRHKHRGSGWTCFRCLEKARNELGLRIRNFNDNYSHQEIAHAHEMRKNEKAERDRLYQRIMKNNR